MLQVYLEFQHLASNPPQGLPGRGRVGTNRFLLTLFCENANKVTVPLKSRGTVKMLTARAAIGCGQAGIKWLSCRIKVGLFTTQGGKSSRGQRRRTGKLRVQNNMMKLIVTQGDTVVLRSIPTCDLSLRSLHVFPLSAWIPLVFSGFINSMKTWYTVQTCW